MPIIDMPVKELEQYKGINPKPVDFDAYWEKALKEMHETDPQVELVKAKFQTPQVECWHLYFTGVNGARIHVKHLRPKQIEGKIPAVLRFHGYSGDSGDWYEKLGYAASGAAVFSMDCRGQGGYSDDGICRAGTSFHGHIVRGLSEDDPQKLMFRDVFLDAAQLARIAMDLDFVDEKKVYATGGSQGGALTLACAALEPRVAKAAAVYPFLCDYQRVWEMDLDQDAYEELRTYFRNYDPRHEKETEIFTKLGYIDLQHLAPRIKANMLVVTGLMDHICPPSTQYAAYNKMTCPKKHILYPDYGHEWLRDVDDIIFEFLMQEEMC